MHHLEIPARSGNIRQPLTTKDFLMKYRVIVAHATSTAGRRREVVVDWTEKKDDARKVYRKYQKLYNGTSARVLWETSDD